MTRVSRLSLCAFIMLLLAALDQLSKWYVIERYFRLRSYESDGPSLDFLTWLTTIPQERFPFYKVEITSFFNLVMVWNKGVSFGMFSSSHEWMPFALGLMALTLCSVFLVWMWRSTSLFASLALALIVSGAVSNVWDRPRFGGVADFLDFHIAGYHWPAFNIADSCIVIGVACLALHSLFFEKRETKVSAA